MYKSILLGICLIFFVIGVIAVLSFILVKTVLPDKKGIIHIVSFFKEDDTDCTVRISCILNLVTVAGLAKRCRICAVDCGMSPYEKRNLLRAFQREESVIICNKNNFFEKISENEAKSTENGTDNVIL